MSGSPEKGGGSFIRNAIKTLDTRAKNPFPTSVRVGLKAAIPCEWRPALGVFTKFDTKPAVGVQWR
jgi:hypothetical protein